MQIKVISQYMYLIYKFDEMLAFQGHSHNILYV